MGGVDVYLGPRDAVLAFPQAAADVEAAAALAARAGPAEIACWSLRPDEALGRRLAALGFQDGWQPHWHAIEPRGSIGDAGEHVRETPACDRSLPYAGEQHESVLGGDVHHLVALEGDAIVGHAVLDVAGRVGGLYDMGVLAANRRRGHGTALVREALRLARERGCSTVTLNATPDGEPLYRSAGFASLGQGMTWWRFPGRVSS